MYLRKLELKDAPLMLEWMHSEKVTENLSTDFASKTIEDCESFITYSQNTDTDIHMAIAAGTDEYMGTTSLKKIDRVNMTAEFAITVRECAMGKGFSWFGMSEILRLAFEEFHLNRVYWCVSRSNQRAVKFYDNHGFRETNEVPEDMLLRYADVPNLKWYVVYKEDHFESFEPDHSIVGCKIVKIKTIPTADAGNLSVFEAERDFPFPIKRIYYISQVPKDIRRGGHAHKELKQLLFCPYGSIQLVLDNGYKRQEIVLDDPSIGVIIDRPIWRDMLWLEENSALCVAASEYYLADDYIRDYKEFIRYQRDRKTV